MDRELWIFPERQLHVRPRARREDDNIKIDHRETGCEADETGSELNPMADFEISHLT
jgi:hypothetical protein